MSRVSRGVFWQFWVAVVRNSWVGWRLGGRGTPGRNGRLPWDGIFASVFCHLCIYRHASSHARTGEVVQASLATRVEEVFQTRLLTAAGVETTTSLRGAG